MDAQAFGGGVKTVIAYQAVGFQEVVVEFVQDGHELGIGECAFVVGVFRGFDDDHESHFVCPLRLSRAVIPVHSLIAALPIRRTKRCRIDTQNREYSRALLINAVLGQVMCYFTSRIIKRCPFWSRFWRVGSNLSRKEHPLYG